MVRTHSQMFDDVIRIGLLSLAGLALLAIVAWYLAFLYREIRQTGQVVIDRFAVVKDDGKIDDEMGMGLARMLQARLESLGPELRAAQAGVSSSPSASDVAGTRLTAPVGDVRLWTPTVDLQTTLLQPIDMKLSVAGVEVGGLIPWVQRQFSNRRMLRMTVYVQGKSVEVVGPIDVLGIKGGSLRLFVPGADDKPPGYSVIVDRLAHEILRRSLAVDPSNKLELLEPGEFVELSGVLINVARSNRKALLGRSVMTEFAEQLPIASKLADQVPNWPELGYLVAKIAESAQQPAKALDYYQRTLPQLDEAKNPELVKAIKHRIAVLERATESRTTAVAAAEPGPSALPAQIDHSAEIKRVRDSGPEGSVVGLTLATVLETRIARQSQKDVQISARHIYYLARQVGKMDIKTDAGANLVDGIQALIDAGAVEESVWPYKAGEYAASPPAIVATAPKYRITAARKLATFNDIKQALVADGPVVVSIPVFSGIYEKSASNGNVPMPARNERMIGLHAIVVVGYDDAAKRVKFVNSWGQSWGEKGYGYLPYGYLEKYRGENWTFKYAP
jgi:C1A family cysteine protease